MTDTKKINYIKELNGLRGISVLLVFFYHLGFEIFKNGYLGVDIFFLISGFVISTYILQNIELNKFNLKDFYIRRAKRILPIYFLVIIASFILFLTILSFDKLDYFYNTINYSLFFLSNYFFYFSTDYFSNLSSQSPLLHTWSVSIEMQFYLIYPIFLLFLSKYFNLERLKYILLILILSFILFSAFLNFHQNFFLPIFRASELLIGSILFFLYRDFKKKKLNHDFISFIILILLIFFFYFIDKNSSYYLYELLFFLILISYFLCTLKYSFFVKKLFCNNIISYLGKISYSVYLIHFIIIIFFDKQIINTQIKLTVFFATIFLSIITYHFIENPIRKSSDKHNNIFGVLIIIVFFIIILLNFFLINKSIYKNYYINSLKLEEKMHLNFINNINKEKNKIISNLINFNKECSQVFKELDREFIKEFNKCKNDKGINIILGDSHAKDIFFGFSQNLKNEKFFTLSKGGCRIFNNDCYFKDFINFIVNEKKFIKNIFIVVKGSYFLKDTSGGKFESSIDYRSFPIQEGLVIKSATYIGEISSIVNNTYWIGPRYEPNIAIDIKNIKEIIKNNKLDKKKLRKNNEILNENLKIISDKFNIKFIKNKEIFEDFKDTNIFFDEKYLYRDEDHYSLFGAKIFTLDIIKTIKEKYGVLK